MPGNPFTDPNWAADVTDTIDRFVGKVRTTATDKAVVASRGIVFGVLVLIAVLVAVPLLIILLSRSVQELLGFFFDHDRSVWMSYVITGAILMIGGFIALAKRRGGDVA
jgi:hypothetical protein